MSLPFLPAKLINVVLATHITIILHTHPHTLPNSLNSYTRSNTLHSLMKLVAYRHVARPSHRYLQKLLMKQYCRIQ